MTCSGLPLKSPRHCFPQSRQPQAALTPWMPAQAPRGTPLFSPVTHAPPVPFACGAFCLTGGFLNPLSKRNHLGARAVRSQQRSHHHDDLCIVKSSTSCACWSRRSRVSLGFIFLRSAAMFSEASVSSWIAFVCVGNIWRRPLRRNQWLWCRVGWFYRRGCRREKDRNAPAGPRPIGFPADDSGRRCP